MPVHHMVEKIRTQDLTSLEITEVIIERIEKINPIINVYCTTTFDLARQMAQEADKRVKRGKKLGLLNGIPTSIKDLNMVKGVRTTFGSKIYEHFVPEEDCLVVSKLRNEGAVFLGKTNTPEFGFKGVTENLIFGVSKNPWDKTKTTGGSSGGAGAAVAAGISPLAQGSDGGGSIRIPSSLNGTYGIKPSFGRVSSYPREFIFAYDLSQNGPIVNYVTDAALMLDAMKGPYMGDWYSLPKDNISYYNEVSNKPNKVNIGYSVDLGYVKAIDPVVEKVIRDSVLKFRKFDWQVEEARVKLQDPEEHFLTLWSSLISFDLSPHLQKWRHLLDPGLINIIDDATRYTAQDLPKAMLERKEFCDSILPIFEQYDVLITPTTAIPAFDLTVPYPSKINGKRVSVTAWHAFTYPFNLTGQPAASIPCGFSSDGLPIGMQIVGRRFDELTVLQVSKAFEEIAPWQKTKPNFD